MGLLWALFPALAPADGSTDGEKVKKRLRQVEDSLRAGEWARAEADATKTIDWMVSKNASGEGALPFYGLAYAFRAIAEEGLGQRAAALFDWDAARMLDAGAIDFDVEPFGEPATRLATEALDRRSELGKPVDRLRAGEGAWPILISQGEAHPAYPEAAKRTGERVQIRIFVLIDEEGRIRAPQVEPLEDQIGRTGFVVSCLEALRYWKFEAARHRGVALAAPYSLTFNLATR